MEFFSVIANVFLCQNLCISDRMNTAEAKFSVSVQDLPSLTEMQSICTLVPSRDNFTMTFKNASDDIVTLANGGSGMPDFSEVTNGQLPNDIVDISVRIDKTVEANRFSVYDFNSFAQHLHDSEMTEVLSWFASRLASKSRIIFEMFDSDISFATGTMAFVSSGSSEFKPKINRCERIQVCKNISSFYNMDMYEVLPEDFLIEGIEQSDNCLRPLFGRLSTILSLAYAAPSASIEKAMLNVNIDKDSLGDRLEKVILFGSYARGDFDSESDIDFCILANVPKDEATKWRRDINSRIPGIDLEYDMLVSLHVINSTLFHNHVDVLPFYRSVLQEGVELGG